MNEPAAPDDERPDGSAAAGDDERVISAELLSAVVPVMPDAAVVVDSVGRIVSVNGQAEGLFGYESDSLIGTPVEALVPERIRDRHRRHRRGFTATPQVRPMGVGLQLTGRRFDGSQFPVDISLAPITSEGEQLVVAAIRDVSAQRQAAAAQAALRRVATLVARGVPPEEVFATVTAEVGRLMDVDLVSMDRYDPDGKVTVLAAQPATLTSGWNIGGRNVSTLVFESGRPARIDDYSEASGPGAVPTREWGVRSAVGAPIIIEGRLWGVMFIASRRARALPADTESRLADFTELVAMAIANAEAQTALTDSRARIVAAADAARRRIGRDLHDGAQQRLVSLTLQLRAAQAAAPPEAAELSALLDRVADGLTSVLNEFVEFARGIHPAILTEGGLGPALQTLAGRSPIPVDVDVRIPGRLPEPLEVCTYYLVSEALTNAAKHSQASAIAVEVTAADDVLLVRIRDNGVGGASFGTGSGLVGLKDRVETLGGRFVLQSKPGRGTTVGAELQLSGNGVA